MKNEIKILIAAIVVILIILVGAFALSGSSPQPSATPTAVPVTATPTPVPANGGNTGTGAASPTPAPTVAPTATPSPTPTPSPSSGVKQTEFGYWITYPPLDPQKWSTNPPPNPGPENNTVYFDPTSADVKVPYFVKPAALKQQSGTPAVIHRVGDLNGTTTVGVYVIASDNMVWGDSYVSHYYIPLQANMTWIGSGHSYFNLTFGPGVSERTVYIEAYGVENYVTEPTVAGGGSDFKGTVELDIVEVNDGYNIGNNHAFTLNVAVGPSIFFPDHGGYLWDDGGSYQTSGDLAIDHTNTSMVFVKTWIARDGDFDKTQAVTFSTYGTLPDSAFIIEPFAFAGGETEKQVTIGINKDYINDGNNFEFYLDDTGDYFIGDFNGFSIWFNNPESVN